MDSLPMNHGIPWWNRLKAAIAKPTLPVKVLVSFVVLFHLSAIFIYVIGGGGPFAMKQPASYLRPYLKTMWLDNAYRFYAPDPGSTEVFWYKLQYQDGSTRWTQLPRREDFYLRMPFQRHMSIALLASMMNEQQPVNPKDDAASAASVLVNSQPIYRTVLTPLGQVYLRSYARHLARIHNVHPDTGSPLVSMDCFFVHYLIRLPDEMRRNISMYDPRKLSIQFVSTFSADGLMSNYQLGFRERMADDLFVEIVQNEILPMLEANAKLPEGKRKSIWQLLLDYGIPYPLIQPFDDMTEEKRAEFFSKPFDRESLRERYAKVVKRNDKETGNTLPQPEQTAPATSSPGAPKPPDKVERGIQ